MKKILLTIAFASAMFAVNAQDMMSKKGVPILPEAGDWSIGISATPFIDWAFDKTRVFSNTAVSSSNGAINSQIPMTLTGLYVVDATTAYRGMVRIGFGSTSTTQGSVADSVLDPTKVTTNATNITLGAGIQKTRGKGRLHGIYGVMADIGFGGNSDVTNTYALPIPVANTGESRTDETKVGSTFMIGVNGFLGVEYFFAPKMSFSAEYGWGINFSTTAAGSTTTETATGTTVTTTTTNGAKSSNFGADVSNIGGGNVIMHFYF